MGVHVKRSVRAGYKPLCQISRRLVQNNMFNLEMRKHDLCVKKINQTCRTPDEPVTFYKKLIRTRHFVLRTNKLPHKDNRVQLKSGHIGIVEEIHSHENQTTFKICLVNVKNYFFTLPVKLSLVGIYEVKELKEMQWISLADVFGKMIVPKKKDFVCILLLHSHYIHQQC